MSFRKEGNEYFKNKEYEKAIKSYTEGIMNDEDDKHLLLSNRALVYYNLKDYENSLKDCVELCKIKNDWYKGWFRLYQTLEKLEKFEEAEKAKKRYEELYDNENNKVTNYETVNDLNNFNMDNLNNMNMDNLDLNNLNPNKMMKDPMFMNMINKVQSNPDLMKKLMDPNLMNNMMKNKDNPMAMMEDESFKDLFNETLNILNN